MATITLILRQAILPLAIFGLAGAGLVYLLGRYPLYSVAAGSIVLLVGVLNGRRLKKLDEARGWRVCHQGRDEIFYEELRDGHWERIELDGERLVGTPGFLICFTGFHLPSWAEDRREEIIGRIKNKCRPPAYAYEEAE